MTRIAAAAPSHLLYLHGFRSSPRSFKAERLRQWLAANRPELHWWCPQLPHSPAAALALIERGLSAWPAGRDETRGGRVGHQHRPCETMEVCEMEVLKAQNDRARPWGSFLSAWPDGWMRDEEGMVGHQHRPSRDHGGLSI